MVKKKQGSPTVQPEQEHHLPIVGIGASAGGLEALELFLKNVPPSCGLAFVIVPHLDPNHKDMMVELLQRHTAMPVIQVKDRMRVEPDRVYIIPPDRDMSLLHGVLHLQKPVESSGLRLSIDHFFRSLADDRQERGIGVILSGMGSDGTLGLRAIKEKSGGAFVQNPASAQFDSMPRSAIDAGLADVIAPPEELANRILAYLQHGPLFLPPPRGDNEKNKSSMEKIILLLRSKTHHDFSLYKKSTLYRRIERRMGLHQLNKISHYTSYLQSNPQEIELLFKELLIGVTSFFRDPAMWEQLKAEVIPALVARAENATLRAWVTACSTGEEAYSLAMVFREALEEFAPTSNCKLQIFATDLDKDAIEKARVAVYPANIAADVSEARLRRFFIREEHGLYRVNQDIREMVIFAPQNLIVDPPFTRLDLVTCRNLLIYLESALQKKLLSLFHYSLNPDGTLVLGISETVGQASELFVQLPGKTHLYWRQNNTQRFPDFAPTLSLSRPGREDHHPSLPPPPSNLPNLAALTDELLLRQYTPSAVLTTSQGDIVYLSAKTGKYLEPTVGKANMNIFAMAREGLAGPLNEAFARTVREETTITLKDLRIQTNGSAVTVDVIVQHLSKPTAMQGMVLIVFRETNEPPAKNAKSLSRKALHDARITELIQELQDAREEVQLTREEMQASQEELKAANEELQSTNEELQSTNEELTTSKEEMQSMNEELQTINQELTNKVDELSRVRDDMENLLNSTDIAVLFLDSQLRVRRFTPKTTNIFKLIPGDAGRPITDQANELDYPDFAGDVQQVLRSLVPRERKVSTRDGRWFAVRILPYHTRDKRFDGTVITFIDISESKTLERVVAQALAILHSRFDNHTPGLEVARDLEQVLRNAQAVLEKRNEDQTVELNQALTNLRQKEQVDETEPDS